MTEGKTDDGGSGAGLKHVASEALLDAATSFDDWWEQQTADSREWSTLERLAAREAWDAATRAALRTCKEYAHSGVNQYRRQVSYACMRRIQDLASNAGHDRTSEAQHNEKG